MTKWEGSKVAFDRK